MKGLYKGRYLIAVYDKDDYLVDVACLPDELLSYDNKDTARQIISHLAMGRRSSDKIYLIDALEEHDDIFIEEDGVFLDFVKETRKKSCAEKAQELGMNERSYYRNKKSFESNCHEMW